MIETLVIKNDLSRAAGLIKAGGLVAVPTETVYGLACNGMDENAVNRVYEVKGRPAVKPLSFMVAGPEMLDSYCRGIPPAARVLAERFWPGPLTIVLEADPSVPDIVRAGGRTVGLRCPDHPLTLEVLRLAGVPFAAPSANPSGAPSPKSAQKVLEYFDGSIDAVIDGGPCGIGVESTIIDMSTAPYKILRPGALPEETISGALADAMTLIGISGGSGSGKTTALKVLADMGALVIDCDAVYHQLLNDSPALISELGARFPSAVIQGLLDRKALAALVFNDKAALAELNAISHRYVALEVQRLLCAWAMAGGTLAAVDAVELFSSGLAARCKATFAVVADRERRIRRIMQRDDIDREHAQLRLNAQHPDSYYVENSDHVLYNDTSPEDFAALCRRIFLEVI